MIRIASHILPAVLQQRYAITKVMMTAMVQLTVQTRIVRLIVLLIIALKEFLTGIVIQRKKD
jgi:hypothetical protein